MYRVVSTILCLDGLMLALFTSRPVMNIVGRVAVFLCTTLVAILVWKNGIQLDTLRNKRNLARAELEKLKAMSND